MQADVYYQAAITFSVKRKKTFALKLCQKKIYSQFDISLEHCFFYHGELKILLFSTFHNIIFQIGQLCSDVQATVVLLFHIDPEVALQTGLLFL